MANKFEIPDKRSTDPADYERMHRRGRLKRSWKRGAKRRHDGRQTVSFDDGLTWGSIGQLLGYLFGEVDNGFQNDLYERLVAQYELTDRGSPLAVARFRGTSISVGTWNLRYSGEVHSYRRLQYLVEADWDAVALQEVSLTAWDVFQREGIAEGGCYTLDGFGLTPTDRRHHGVAILVRNGFRLRDPQLISGLPKTERALSLTIEGLTSPVEIIAWHAPNAAGEGVAVKMQAYTAISNCLRNRKGPTILAFDGNHWNRNIGLELRPINNPQAPFHAENLFYASNAPHDLQDSLMEFYRENDDVYRELIGSRSSGPLAVSYVRGSSKRPVEDRFDYVFVSPAFRVEACHYDYEGATRAGSDHAFVVAELGLEG